MREYEAMIIAKADLPEPELSKMVSKWETIIGTDGGQVVKKETWGVRRLAYPINKQNRGNYFVYDIATNQANVHELERVLKLEENVLRSMVIKLADNVNVEDRRLELQKQAEAAAQRAAEAAREKAESESLGARRGRDDE
ncbi:30S ribosomal protein S6 [Silvanigrella paludirubra]|jgi:small subunit ribosomal protein S6|uniref:Small ribosomal subunit protein bS6 n=1 Tax=Silvanigrella paludirubra TaxID=2499159 RepID=A0A6N6VTD7_9BACT|nr:30S ribosomal protein S6 [Silvanigrella paludirubra]KAB8037956.1 30S ribosomal protein S6 [Silvanigrella paludirubra]